LLGDIAFGESDGCDDLDVWDWLTIGFLIGTLTVCILIITSNIILKRNDSARLEKTIASVLSSAADSEAK